MQKMSSLSEDLEACVHRTEDMLIGWTEFALKYSKANVDLDVQLYRERLLSAFKKFDEVSQEVDKIVFCSVDKSSNLATEPSRSAVTTRISTHPSESAEYVVKTMNSPNLSVDSSSQSSAEISQPNLPAELIAPNVRIGDQRRNAKHLSPARFKNEARRFESRKNNVMSPEVGRKSYTDFATSDEDDHLVVDLTEDSPLLLEIDQVYSLDDEFTNESISSTNVKDSEKANPVSDLSASRSLASIFDRNTDIMPLSEQLFLSDEDSISQSEDTARFLKSSSEKAVEIPASSHSLKRNKNPKASPASSQSEYVLSPGFPANTQSFFEVSPGSSRVTLSVPNKAPTNYTSKNKKNLVVRFGDNEKWTPARSKNSQRKEPSAWTCGLCRQAFPTLKLRSDHMAAMHPDIFRTFCRGCGLRLRRFEAVPHYSRCLVYQHKNHVDRINGMRRILNKADGVLLSSYDINHLKRQRKLLAECNEIDIPAVPPHWRVPKKIDAYFETSNWPCNSGQRN